MRPQLIRKHRNKTRWLCATEGSFLHRNALDATAWMEKAASVRQISQPARKLRDAQTKNSSTSSKKVFREPVCRHFHRSANARRSLSLRTCVRFKDEPSR